jgi:hypothetical protein
MNKGKYYMPGEAIGVLGGNIPERSKKDIQDQKFYQPDMKEGYMSSMGNRTMRDLEEQKIFNPYFEGYNNCKWADTKDDPSNIYQGVAVYRKIN